jgi:Tol biopolymer transport system component
MNQAAWTRRALRQRTAVSLLLGASLGATSASGVSAGEGPRLLAWQRIRSADVGTLEPPSLSQEGRFVAFVAGGSQRGKRWCCRNVYVLDRITGAITQESVNADETPPTGESAAPRLSADGRVIAFETVAASLLFGQGSKSGRRVIVRDRLTGVMRTPVARGVAPNGETSQPALSGSGLVVAFTSDATNLATGRDSERAETDVYVWRLDADTIERVSVNVQGTKPASGGSHSPSIDANGDLVAFVSAARLVPEDTNDVLDVYLRDVGRGRTRLVSRSAAGAPTAGGSFSPALSADGRYVAFVSMATNLGAADRNSDSDIYVHDVATGATMLVSATARGEAANSGSRRPALSADGRLVVYQSVASNLGSATGCPPASQDANLLPDIYLLDRHTQCVTRISGSSAPDWWSPSVAPAIDGAGTVVLFSSTQLVDGEVTSNFNLFERLVDRGRDRPEAPVPTFLRPDFLN